MPVLASPIRFSMRFKQILLSLALCAGLATPAFAQEKTEAGLHVFASQYLGDLRDNLGSRSDYMSYMLKLVHPGVGVFIRYNQSSHLAFRGNISYSGVSGADSLSSSQSKKYRNLSFRSTVLEFSGQVEYNFISFGNEADDHNFTPYVFAGLGIFRFNPQAYYQGEWYDLQPLGTEGQGLVAYPNRERYAQTSVCVPVGAGLKFRLSDYWRLGIEYGHRFIFTDYLDDVSKTHVDPELVRVNNGPVAAALADRTGEVLPGGKKIVGTNRGNDQSNDAYFFFGFTLSYLFDRTLCPGPAY